MKTTSITDYNFEGFVDHCGVLFRAGDSFAWITRFNNEVMISTCEVLGFHTDTGKVVTYRDGSDRRTCVRRHDNCIILDKEII